MMEKDVANEAKQHSPWVSEQRDAQILGLSVKIVLVSKECSEESAVSQGP